ncbi:MAG: family N-acetyltransferase [Chitinophagaceae bacterium]|nr:family N-acetyltransferase [Chitinophagaceae bacterium]
MRDPGNIQYITHKEIDKKKWDACIDHADNGLIYSYSFYLDHMATHWDALILNDYEAVMPLPYKRKLYIYYLFQPFLTPVLGVFGKNIDEALVSRFLAAIPEKFKLRDISLNHFNKVNEKFMDQYRRRNYVLSLASSYETIRNNYSENINRNISKAQQAGCILKKNIDVREIIDLCKREWPKFTKIENGTFENLAASFSIFRPYSTSYGIYHPEGKLLASCVFLSHAGRSYYWLVGNDPKAKKFGASPMLIDQFIQDYAGSGNLLDFEGSDKLSIAEFYQRFGARPEPYTTLYQNFLPFPFNHLKKTPADYRLLIS